MSYEDDDGADGASISASFHLSTVKTFTHY